MEKLMYAPDALEKLQIMKQDIADRHGAEIARKVIMKIKRFRDCNSLKTKVSL